MKKIPVIRHLMVLAISSVLLCTMALTASADDDDRQRVDDRVDAITISAPTITKYPMTARYLGLLFQRAM